METKLNSAQYIRCSTDEQASSGYGLEIQEEKNNALVTLKDFESSDEYIYSDEGFSGTLPPDKRPGLKKMLEDAKAGKFDVLVVYKIDRLARDNYITLGVVKRLDSYGVKLISATEPFDTSTTVGNFMVQLLGATAEMDRNNIVERTTAGRKLSAKKGTWVFGSPPYGYKYNRETQRLEIIKEQAKWVKKFHEWLVYEQLPLREIAHRANQLKVLTPLISSKSNRTSTGLWYPRTMGRILSNDAYVGVKCLGKYKNSPKNYKMVIDPKNINPESEWTAVHVPQVISEHLHLSALRQLKRNSEMAKRKKIRDYMFSGLIHCSKCGFKLYSGYAKPTSGTSKGSKFYYSCLRGRDYKIKKSKKCKYCGSVAESRLMPVWYALEKILSKPDIVYKKLEKFAEENNSETKQKNFVAIQKRREGLGKERERLNTAYIDVGSIDSREYKKKLRTIDEKFGQLVQDEARLVGTVLSKKEQTHGKQMMEKLFKQYKKNLKNASYETKMQILQIFVNSVNLNLTSNIATVELNFANVDVLRDNSHDGGLSNSKQLSLKDNCPDGCLSISKQLEMIIPIITSKEIAIAEYPTHSKHYKVSSSNKSPLEVLSKRKAKRIKLMVH